MKKVAFLIAALVMACSSSSSEPAAPIIDNLVVPATTTPMTLQGQTGPGIIITLSAHADDSGIAALHVMFTETKADHAIQIPGAPTTLTSQPIELVVPGAPSGAHALAFHIVDAKGRSSNVINKTITVP